MRTSEIPRYLALNLPVFPCAPGLKKPATERGFHDASLDPDVVNRWFGEGSKYNVGIPTGAVSGGWVLDIDPGKGGTESLAKLTEGIELPSTPIARTGRGGLHYWWAMPDRKVKSTAGLMPGIDVRGDGGYVVVPPSVFESQYEWLVAPWDVPFAVCPAESVRRLEEAYQQGKDPDYGDGARGQGFDIEAALRGVPEGERDVTLFQLASRLRADNVGVDSAIAMLEMAARNCDPPFDARLARAKVEWVYRRYQPGWSAEARQRVSGPVTASVTDSDAEPEPDPATPDPEPPRVHVLREDPWPHTDVGNAERLASILRGRAHWCHPWKSWIVWDGTRWKRDETGGAPIMQEAFALVKGMATSAKDPHALTWAKKTQERKHLNAMVELAKTRPGVYTTPDDLDRNDWLLNVANGTLELRTGELRAHRREDLITRITNVPYDPDADITRWAAFLDRVTDGSRDLQLFLYRAAGYSLTGSTREQALMFLYGTGRNGKSTFMDLLMHVMGEYAIHTPTETLMVKGNNSNVPNDVARLKGARLVAATETEAGKRLAESLVKQLTGGDQITARFLHAEYFTFVPTFKLWLSGNHLPAIYGVDEGIWRRIRLVPFEVSIPEHEVDPDLKDRLKEESTGILAWCVSGALDWQREGLLTPSAVLDATSGYRREMDTISEFIEDHVEEAPGEFLTSRDLFEAYRSWCEGLGEKPRTQKALSSALKKKGYEPIKGRARGFPDLRVMDSNVPP